MSTREPNRSLSDAVQRALRDGVSRSGAALRSTAVSQSGPATLLPSGLRSRAARWASRQTGGDAVEALRDSWSRYPEDWKRDPGLNLGATTLGEEWGGPAFADFIVELVSPYLRPDVDVLELGCGGGKFSRRLAPRCRSLICTDISADMVEHTKEEIRQAGFDDKVSYRILNGVNFAGVKDASADFIFSYDVQLHLQPQNVFSYMLDARRVLRQDGVLMLHQINLDSEGGMGHFLGQYSVDTWKRSFDDPRRRGHIYYMSADQMTALANEAGLQLERIEHDSEQFRQVTRGRDLIGFLRKQRGRLEPASDDGLELVKAQDDFTVYAVIDGRRVRFGSSRQFERAGLRWEDVRELSPDAVQEIPDGGTLELWE